MQIIGRSPRIALVLMAALLASCSSGEKKPDVTTGWLGELTAYKRVSGKDAAGVFVRASDAAAKPLDAVRFAPVEITVAANSDYYSVAPAHLAEMRDSLAGILKDAIGPVVPIRAATAPDTYTLRIALTNLTIKQSNRQSTVARREDYRFGFDGASIEAELRDGSTNMRRAVILTPVAGAGRRAARDAERDRWADLAGRFRTAAAAFRADLEIAKQALAKLPAVPSTPAKPDEAAKDGAKAAPKSGPDDTPKN